MISGVILLLGGIAFFCTGLGVDVPVLALLGGIWAFGGIVNVIGSKLARAATANEAVAGGAGFTPAPTVPPGGRSSHDDPLNPLVLARKRQTARGAGGRGLISLICAALAVVVGIVGGIPWMDGPFGPPDTSNVLNTVATAMQPWRLLPLITGIVLGMLSVLGLLASGVSGAERAATHDATVTLLGYKDRGLNNSSGRPYIQAVLDVRAVDLPRYEATITAVIPMLAVPKLFIGNHFSALVAGPDQPSVVIVDWNSGATLGSAPTPPPLAPPTRAAHATISPAAPAADPGHDPAGRLRELDELRAQGLVTEPEYQAQRTRILDSL